MNSLMSMRIRCSSLSNRKPASALHSSVLPTPVGPRNRKEPVGRFGSDRPARERRIALATAAIASSWPTTRSCSLASICSSLSRSPCISLETGMPVARATTSAISSAPTMRAQQLRLAACRRPSSASLACASFSVFSSSGSLPYCSSATLLKSPLRLSSSIWKRMRSISSLHVRRALRGGLLGLPDLLEVGVLALAAWRSLPRSGRSASARPRPSPCAPPRARSSAGSAGGRACPSPRAWSRSRS